MSEYDDTHKDDEKTPDEVELTASEKKALETLPRDRMPSADLEDRVVSALREQGVLAPARGRVIQITARRIAAVVAASVALLAGGFALGQWAGARQATSADVFAPASSDISVAATLQRAGSEYVLALERFAELPDSVDGEQAVQGREVALTTLYTAADQVTRLVPKDELIRQLLVAIDAKSTAKAGAENGASTTVGTRVIEF